MRFCKLITAAFVSIGALGAQSFGASLAYDATGATTGGATGDLNIGRQFTVTGAGITVYDLGIFDSAASPTSTIGDGLVAAHDVTLFSIDHTGGGATPTATINVPASGVSVNVPLGTAAPLDGGFRFASLASPLFLPAGTYALIAYGTNHNTDAYGDAGSNTFPVGSNAANGGFDPYQFTSAGSPAFPNSGDSNNHTSVSFHFDNGNTLPEPTSLTLLGLSGLVLARRRRI